MFNYMHGKNNLFFYAVLYSWLALPCEVYNSIKMLYMEILPRGLRHELSSIARSNAGIVGSNPTQGKDVCVRLFCV
jgi:hypothetical protein